MQVIGVHRVHETEGDSLIDWTVLICWLAINSFDLLICCSVVPGGQHIELSYMEFCTALRRANANTSCIEMQHHVLVVLMWSC